MTERADNFAEFRKQLVPLSHYDLATLLDAIAAECIERRILAEATLELAAFAVRKHAHVAAQARAKLARLDMLGELQP